MATKTFRAPNMLVALQDVQRHFGPNAIVLSMRQVPKGPFWAPWRKPGCEVVATLDPLPKAGARPAEASAARLAPRLARPFVPTAFGEEKAALPQPQPAAVAPAIPRPVTKPATAAPATLPAGMLKIRARLLAQGLDEALLRRILSNCLQVLPPEMLEDETRLKSYVRLQLEAGLKSAPRPMAFIPSRLACLVGTTGSGKTSACAKIASFFTLTLNKKVVWVAADMVRTAAIAETRVYTDALGIPLELVYTPDELEKAVAAHPEADLILVDTPGCNPRRETQVLELGSYLTRLPKRATYLLAPATTKEADLNQALAAFGAYNIKGLIVTRTDETASFGDLYNFTSRSQIPILYYTSGSQAMGDLHAGEPEKLVAALLDGGMEG